MYNSISVKLTIYNVLMKLYFTWTLQLLDILFDLHLEVDLLDSETPKQPIKLSYEHQVLNLTTSFLKSTRC